MEPTEGLLDMELLDENAEIGIEGLRELIGMYLAQADEILASLASAIQLNDADAVNRLAHKLAGSSAVCGVTSMVTPLRAIELCGREQRISDAAALLSETHRQLDVCKQLLADYLADKAGQPS